MQAWPPRIRGQRLCASINYAFGSFQAGAAFLSEPAVIQRRAPLEVQENTFLYNIHKIYSFLARALSVEPVSDLAGSSISPGAA